MNWFLEMFGLRDFVEYDEYRNWKRQGLKVNPAHLRTQLLPQLVEYEEIIREVLLCHRGDAAPIADLFLNWVATCPERSFKRLVSLASSVVAAITTEINNKNSEAAKGKTKNA